MATDDSSSTPRRRFLTLEDVRDTLAITDTMTYTLLRSGALRGLQVGPKRVWRVEESELEAYIERQYTETRRRIEEGSA